MSRMQFTVLLALALIGASPSWCAEKIPAGAKVFIAPMDGFETHLQVALAKKKVPLTIVTDRTQADYELAGTAHSQKASTAKKLVLWDWQSTEQASIKLTNLKSGVIAFAYSVHKASSTHGKRSTAEACAKHLYKAIAQP